MDVSGGYSVDHPAIALEVAVEPFPVPGAKRWRACGFVPCIHHGFWYWDEGMMTELGGENSSASFWRYFRRSESFEDRLQQGCLTC